MNLKYFDLLVPMHYSSTGPDGAEIHFLVAVFFFTSQRHFLCCTHNLPICQGMELHQVICAYIYFTCIWLDHESLKGSIKKWLLAQALQINWVST